MNPAYKLTRFRADQPEAPPREFIVLTAWNPEGEERPADEYLEADRELREWIGIRGWSSFPVTATSPDFRHLEPGHAVACTLDEGLDLAARFRQEAIFHIEDGRVTLVPADGSVREPLGRWENLVIETDADLEEPRQQAD